jgi:hypothetical protein
LPASARTYSGDDDEILRFDRHLDIPGQEQMAQTAKGILDEAAIDSIIQSDPTVVNSRYDAPRAFSPGAIAQLMVRAEDLDKAWRGAPQTSPVVKLT